MKRLAFVGILFLTSSLSAQPVFSREGVGAKISLRRQTDCENEFIREARAEEILAGPPYRTLVEVAAAFGRKAVPRLYFVPGDGNAVYVGGSVYVDGRGKILISETYLRFLGDTMALKGILAHETAHLVKDNGAVGCYEWVLRDPEQEKAADALAARMVGYEAVRAFLLRTDELLGVVDVDLRLRALEILEDKEKRR